MKTKYFFLAAAAALFAACSSDDGIAEQQQAKQQAEQVPVGFSAYVNRGTTRAGNGGELITSTAGEGQIDLETKGFGVFAYYTDNQLYGPTSIPDFMYNQKVTYDSKWTYSPVKYWPNEFGSDAESTGEDKLTFFAYAPWVNVDASTGRLTTSDKTGILGLTSNTTAGDPYVKYGVDFTPGSSVDLCWGVANADYESSVADPSLNDIDGGDPYLNVSKPKVGDNINFAFKHALAWLNVQIDADVDKKSEDATTQPDKNTRIWVRSVTFEGFAEKGALNLNASSTNGPLWYELSSTNTLIGSCSTTICDGRIDGKEGQDKADAKNETTGLNEALLQKVGYKWDETNGLEATTATYTGVRAAAVNLFNSATLTAPVFVIPNGDVLKVTIVYDVETYDTNLAGYLSDGKSKGKTVENKITKTISTTGASPEDITMVAGKKYIIKLHLGMTSVQFEANVTEWGETKTGEPWLPINDEAASPAKRR